MTGIKLMREGVEGVIPGGNNSRYVYEETARKTGKRESGMLKRLRKSSFVQGKVNLWVSNGLCWLKVFEFAASWPCSKS